MTISVTISKCSDCRHQDHSGAFTPGGAKPICSHPAIFTYTKKLTTGDDAYDWRHRTLPSFDCAPPSFCPLRSGNPY